MSTPASLVLFEAGSTLFAVDARHVQEVVEAPVPTPVPWLPQYFVGLTSWRGRALPVIDLAALLNLRSQSPPEHAIVLIAGAYDALLLCDRIRGFVDAPPELAPLPEPLRAHFASLANGAVEHEGARAVVLPAVQLLARAAIA